MAERPLVMLRSEVDAGGIAHNMCPWPTSVKVRHDEKVGVPLPGLILYIIF